MRIYVPNFSNTSIGGGWREIEKYGMWRDLEKLLKYIND